MVDVRSFKEYEQKEEKAKKIFDSPQYFKKTVDSFALWEKLMSDSGFKRARQLTDKGFNYDNLVEMANLCREETNPDKILSAYILNRVLSDLAAELGDGIVLTNELRKLEAKYRTALNLALECAEAGAPQEEQNRRLTDLVKLLWTPKEPA